LLLLLLLWPASVMMLKLLLFMADTKVESESSSTSEMVCDGVTGKLSGENGKRISSCSSFTLTIRSELNGEKVMMFALRSFAFSATYKYLNAYLIYHIIIFLIYEKNSFHDSMVS